MDLHALIALAQGRLKGTLKVRTTAHGRELRACCPLHSDRTPSFDLNLDTGVWNCLAGCGGGWIDALLIRLGYQEAYVKEATQGLSRPSRPKWKPTLAHKPVEHLPEEILAIFDRCPLRLLDEGWPEEILEKYEVGYDKGRGRITFPIRDLDGKLIAISGRSPYAAVTPRYKIYDEEDLYEYAPPGYRPPRARFLYNGHRALTAQKDETVVIFEGFKQVLRLDQVGYKGVSLVGVKFTRDQITLLNRLYFKTRCRFVVMFDNDKPGIERAAMLCRAITTFTRPWITVTQPEKDISDISDFNKIQETIQTATPYTHWKPPILEAHT